MRRLKIDPQQHPIQKGESWWVVHPNTAGSEFRIPSGAITVCLEDLLIFKKDIAYNVVALDAHNGWITVEGSGDLYEMPQYLFARHFDAEAFVVGRPTEDEATAIAEILASIGLDGRRD